MNNTTTGITTKVLFAVFFAVLFVTAFPAAAQESMIPDDFDWSYYYQNDDWDSWGSAPQQNYYQDNYGYEQPFTYEWGGETYELNTQDTWVNDPNWWSTGSFQDTAGQQTYEWNGSGQQQTNNDPDGWFYLSIDDYFDDFNGSRRWYIIGGYGNVRVVS